ncbi:conserved hypothetical protein [Theileria equi strain WA]|uniref:ATPTG10-like domain-containing protein n=1 Tax=Theileria equi strain WA TaxID=1537102 RepID=L1LA47_THEEQ|nr:conserved hypothetical protein [Theileria equi strain WA]EKX72105.1 conserved hypothetical protein [Theileria equi strain WA]|eukprot:XP_004831557.1 conserved hypothetical protein [Theileria equi strain WA]
MEKFGSDLESINKFADSIQHLSPEGMVEAFNKFSWDDQAVAKHLPVYCKASPEELKKVDDAFVKLVPSQDKVYGPNFNTMALWLKTRIHMQMGNHNA